jgi:spore coat protein CotH
VIERLRHRIPVRLRHYWRPVVALAAFLAVTLGVFGNAQVRPYITSDERSNGAAITQDIAGGPDIFDTKVAHSVTVRFDNDDYQRLLTAFAKDGDKDYLEADLTIDGTTVPSVGLRLKGNSTLMSLRNSNSNRGAGARPGAGQPDDGDAGAPGGGRGGGMGMAALSKDEPETLPWLISFDEYAKGRRYQGHQAIAVRPSSTQTPTVMNEALALSLTGAAGEATQKFAWSKFTVNDRPAVTRLLLEDPDDTFVDDTLGGDGVLYKALSTGQFTDQGNDQTDYQDDFGQINLKGSQDLQPVIDLVQWVSSASDQEFEKHLGDHVDVPSFARYIALQNLMLNFDDMSGPGKNYYLWYDLGARKFTVITWDLNLTFSGDASQKPDEAGGFGRGGGGGPGGGGFQPPDGFDPTQADPDAAGGAAPGGVAPGGAAPGGAAPGGAVPGGGFGGGQGGGRMMSGNALKEKFLASDALKAVYHQQYREVYQKLFANGTALSTITTLSASLKTTGADAAQVDQDAEALRAIVTARTTALATDDVVTGKTP